MVVSTGTYLTLSNIVTPIIRSILGTTTPISLIQGAPGSIPMMVEGIPQGMPGETKIVNSFVLPLTHAKNVLECQSIQEGFAAFWSNLWASIPPL